MQYKQDNPLFTDIGYKKLVWTDDLGLYKYSHFPHTNSKANI